MSDERLTGRSRFSSPRLKRREVLKGAAGLGAAAALGGFPAILKGQGQTIKVGMPSIFSGRVGILGESSRAGALLEIEKFNKAGGLNGRTIELITRDSKGKPDEAARVVRDLVNNDGCQVIIDAEASSGAFAVHEVARDLGVLTIHTNSETSSLTANPKQFIPTVFRSARQGIHDAVGGGEYAAGIAKEKELYKWMSCSPDYAYGRANTEEFMEYARIFEPKIRLVDQTWPKLFQPDYTEVVTKILQTKPEALYSALWGGDLVSFIDQASLYGLFGQFEAFAVNLGDYPVLTAVKNLPQGIHSGNRYNADVPDTPENQRWYDDYVANHGHQPTNWSWENAVGARMMVEAIAEAGDTDSRKLAEAIEGRTISTHIGDITMRAEDHTIVGYPVGYGITIPEPPYMENFQSADWETIFELEKEWKKRQNFA